MGLAHMSALLAMLAGKASTYIAGAVIVVVAFLATYFKGWLAGSKIERTKQKAKEADAYAKHIEDIERAANARPSGRVSDDPYNRDRQ